MKAKAKDLKSTPVIAYRRRSKNSSESTGLSHYITITNDKKQKRNK